VEEVHIEACRWEHVISESVERRLFELLGYPVRCPHGNAIPGSTNSGYRPRPGNGSWLRRRTAVSDDQGRFGRAGPCRVRRISEQIQSDLVLMLKLKRPGYNPDVR